ncbi:hypothetical protein DMENIID0001_040700 [Sergentomyia squamirostris]
MTTSLSDSVSVSTDYISTQGPGEEVITPDPTLVSEVTEGDTGTVPSDASPSGITSGPADATSLSDSVSVSTDYISTQGPGEEVITPDPTLVSDVTEGDTGTVPSDASPSGITPGPADATSLSDSVSVSTDYIINTRTRRRVPSDASPSGLTSGPADATSLSDSVSVSADYISTQGPGEEVITPDPTLISEVTDRDTGTVPSDASPSGLTSGPADATSLSDSVSVSADYISTQGPGEEVITPDPTLISEVTDRDTGTVPSDASPSGLTSGPADATSLSDSVSVSADYISTQGPGEEVITPDPTLVSEVTEGDTGTVPSDASPSGITPGPSDATSLSDSVSVSTEYISTQGPGEEVITPDPTLISEVTDRDTGTVPSDASPSGLTSGPADATSLSDSVSVSADYISTQGPGEEVITPDPTLVSEVTEGDTGTVPSDASPSGITPGPSDATSLSDSVSVSTEYISTQGPGEEVITPDPTLISEVTDRDTGTVPSDASPSGLTSGPADATSLSDSVSVSADYISTQGPREEVITPDPTLVSEVTEGDTGTVPSDASPSGITPGPSDATSLSDSVSVSTEYISTQGPGEEVITPDPTLISEVTDRDTGTVPSDASPSGLTSGPADATSLSDSVSVSADYISTQGPGEEVITPDPTLISEVTDRDTGTVPSDASPSGLTSGPADATSLSDSVSVSADYISTQGPGEEVITPDPTLVSEVTEGDTGTVPSDASPSGITPGPSDATSLSDSVSVSTEYISTQGPGEEVITPDPTLISEVTDRDTGTVPSDASPSGLTSGPADATSLSDSVSVSADYISTQGPGEEVITPDPTLISEVTDRDTGTVPSDASPSGLTSGPADATSLSDSVSVSADYISTQGPGEEVITPDPTLVSEVTEGDTGTVPSDASPSGITPGPSDATSLSDSVSVSTEYISTQGPGEEVITPDPTLISEVTDRDTGTVPSDASPSGLTSGPADATSLSDSVSVSADYISTQGPGEEVITPDPTLVSEVTEGDTGTVPSDASPSGITPGPSDATSLSDSVSVSTEYISTQGPGEEVITPDPTLISEVTDRDTGTVPSDASPSGLTSGPADATSLSDSVSVSADYISTQGPGEEVITPDPTLVSEVTEGDTGTVPSDASPSGITPGPSDATSLSDSVSVSADYISTQGPGEEVITPDPTLISEVTDRDTGTVPSDASPSGLTSGPADATSLSDSVSVSADYISTQGPGEEVITPDPTLISEVTDRDTGTVPSDASPSGLTSGPADATSLSDSVSVSADYISTQGPGEEVITPDPTLVSEVTEGDTGTVPSDASPSGITPGPSDATSLSDSVSVSTEYISTQGPGEEVITPDPTLISEVTDRDTGTVPSDASPSGLTSGPADATSLSDSVSVSADYISTQGPREEVITPDPTLVSEVTEGDTGTVPSDASPSGITPGPSDATSLSDSVSVSTEYISTQGPGEEVITPDPTLISEVTDRDTGTVPSDASPSGLTSGPADATSLSDSVSVSADYISTQGPGEEVITPDPTLVSEVTEGDTGTVPSDASPSGITPGPSDATSLSDSVSVSTEYISTQGPGEEVITPDPTLISEVTDRDTGTVPSDASPSGLTSGPADATSLSDSVSVSADYISTQGPGEEVITPDPTLISEVTDRDTGTVPSDASPSGLTSGPADATSLSDSVSVSADYISTQGPGEEVITPDPTLISEVTDRDTGTVPSDASPSGLTSGPADATSLSDSVSVSADYISTQGPREEVITPDPTLVSEVTEGDTGTVPSDASPSGITPGPSDATSLSDSVSVSTEYISTQGPGEEVITPDPTLISEVTDRDTGTVPSDASPSGLTSGPADATSLSDSVSVSADYISTQGPGEEVITPDPTLVSEVTEGDTGTVPSDASPSGITPGPSDATSLSDSVSVSTEYISTQGPGEEVITPDPTLISEVTDRDTGTVPSDASPSGLTSGPADATSLSDSVSVSADYISTQGPREEVITPDPTLVSEVTEGDTGTVPSDASPSGITPGPSDATSLSDSVSVSTEYISTQGPGVEVITPDPTLISEVTDRDTGTVPSDASPSGLTSGPADATSLSDSVSVSADYISTQGPGEEVITPDPTLVSEVTYGDTGTVPSDASPSGITSGPADETSLSDSVSVSTDSLSTQGPGEEVITPDPTLVSEVTYGDTGTVPSDASPSGITSGPADETSLSDSVSVSTDSLSTQGPGEEVITPDPTLVSEVTYGDTGTVPSDASPSGITSGPADETSLSDSVSVSTDYISTQGPGVEVITPDPTLVSEVTYGDTGTVPSDASPSGITSGPADETSLSDSVSVSTDYISTQGPGVEVITPDPTLVSEVTYGDTGTVPSDASPSGITSGPADETSLSDSVSVSTDYISTQGPGVEVITPDPTLISEVTDRDTGTVPSDASPSGLTSGPADATSLSDSVSVSADYISTQGPGEEVITPDPTLVSEVTYGDTGTVPSDASPSGITSGPADETSLSDSVSVSTDSLSTQGPGEEVITPDPTLVSEVTYGDTGTVPSDASPSGITSGPADETSLSDSVSVSTDSLSTQGPGEEVITPDPTLVSEVTYGDTGTVPSDASPSGITSGPADETSLSDSVSVSTDYISTQGPGVEVITPDPTLVSEVTYGDTGTVPSDASPSGITSGPADETSLSDSVSVSTDYISTQGPGVEVITPDPTLVSEVTYGDTGTVPSDASPSGITSGPADETSLSDSVSVSTDSLSTQGPGEEVITPDPTLVSEVTYGDTGTVPSDASPSGITSGPADETSLSDSVSVSTDSLSTQGPGEEVITPDPTLVSEVTYGDTGTVPSDASPSGITSGPADETSLSDSVSVSTDYISTQGPGVEVITPDPTLVSEVTYGDTGTVPSDASPSGITSGPADETSLSDSVSVSTDSLSTQGPGEEVITPDPTLVSEVTYGDTGTVPSDASPSGITSGPADETSLSDSVSVSTDYISTQGPGVEVITPDPTLVSEVTYGDTGTVPSDASPSGITSGPADETSLSDSVSVSTDSLSTQGPGEEVITPDPTLVSEVTYGDTGTVPSDASPSGITSGPADETSLSDSVSVSTDSLSTQGPGEEVITPDPTLVSDVTEGDTGTVPSDASPSGITPGPADATSLSDSVSVSTDYISTQQPVEEVITTDPTLISEVTDRDTGTVPTEIPSDPSDATSLSDSVSVSADYISTQGPGEEVITPDPTLVSEVTYGDTGTVPSDASPSDITTVSSDATTSPLHAVNVSTDSTKAEVQGEVTTPISAFTSSVTLVKTTSRQAPFTPANTATTGLIEKILGWLG